MESELRRIHRLVYSYLIVAVFVFSMLYSLPVPGGYTIEPWVINTCITLMFVLLVFLTARLARMNRTGTGVLLTAAFIMLFNPGAEDIYLRDWPALESLGSQCIVPFFMGQYTRIRRKDFSRWYALMLLMGIFCSYTHNGIAIPLCVTFLWLSFRHFHGFFGRACWPMVVGFAIGTTMSILFNLEPQTPVDLVTTTIREMPSTTMEVLSTLWDTKVFVISLAVTGYFFYSVTGRLMLQRIARRHYVLCGCLISSLFSMPLAPLGIDNAAEGVCFFCMFWLLFIARYWVERVWNKRM